MTKYEQLILEHRNQQRAARKPTRHKYGAIATTVDDTRFDSKAEARRYQELKLMERGRLIRNLELQPRFPIEINGVKVCTYVADFRYVSCGTSEMVVEDTKGFKTPEYKLKKKLMKAVYNIDVLET